jgi:hypothetical protein
MNVIVQNPSSLETKFVDIAVPNGKYDVFVFDNETMDFKAQASSVACYDDLDAKKKPMTSCFQNIQLTKPIGIKDFALMRLDYNESADNTIGSKGKGIVEGDFIGSDEGNENIKLTFKGADAKNSIIYFEQYKIHKSEAGVVSESNETFRFSLNWWASKINYFSWDNGQNSGDYIFRPMTGQYTPNVYSAYAKGQKSGN